MAIASVNITFEAENLADAEAKIGNWKLHEGCQVFATINESLPPAATNAGGEIAPVPQPELASEEGQDGSALPPS
jgi:hypothetical protein